MKALSLWDPWGTLIALGEKQHETRSWKPPFAVGALLAIHVAKRWKPEQENYLRHPAFRQVFAKHGITPSRTTLPLGCIVCAVRLTGVYRTEDIEDLISVQERAFGNYAPGRYAWQLEVVKTPAEPIPARGGQGIWEWKP